ncbi:MAG TPA: class I SAM-dependent methyltransferase [Vicinamibacteria bacterium]|nr:class I SAM-dependent methyltransferase [Vicinamibacteria bacterium]
MTIPRADDRWYLSAFGPLTAAFWTALVPQERIEEEARFVAGALGVGSGSLLLDVPCGAGRHSRALGRLGLRVEGMDASEHMLAAAASEGPVAGVSLRRGDMTALAESSRFDGAFCWGNSFGYAGHEGDRSFLEGVGRALLPGARFVLQSGAVAENLLPAFQQRSEHAADGFHFTAERRYEVAEGAIHVRYRIEKDGVSEEFVSRQQVYRVAEVLRMASAARLHAEALYGGIAGEPAGLGKGLVAVLRRE